MADLVMNLSRNTHQAVNALLVLKPTNKADDEIRVRR